MSFISLVLNKFIQKKNNAKSAKSAEIAAVNNI